VDQAARIAVREVLKHAGSGSLPEEIVFACFSESTRAIFAGELTRQRGSAG
jgi:hypothetical protein